jgi:hypothetical protein
MTGRVFFDTNVLLYMPSSADRQKQRRVSNCSDFKCIPDISGSVLRSSRNSTLPALKNLRLPVDVLVDATTALLDVPIVVVGPEQLCQLFRLEPHTGSASGTP